MDTLIQDIRYAIRMLRGNPTFTAITIITLALGIGANTAIFSVVDTVLFRPLPYEEGDRLVMLSERNEQVPMRWISYPNFLDWRERNRAFEAVSTIRSWQLTLTGAGEPESLNARMISADYFSVMRARPVLGRDFLKEEDRPGAGPVTILSHGFWQRRFGGDENIIGNTINLDNRAFTVVGVMRQDFRHQGTPDLFVLMGQWTGQDNWMQRDVRVAGFVIARLKQGVTLQQAQANMNAVSEQLIEQYPRYNSGHSITVVSLYENIVGDVRASLLLMLGAVGFVLLIACANVANLLLARAATRQKEFAIRAALGAGRFRVIRQLLTESVLLAVMGGALGLLLAWWGVDLLAAAEAGGIPRLSELSVDHRVLGFTLLISLMTGIIFGLAPALQITKDSLQNRLKESSRTTSEGRGGKMRGALVVSEVAMALVLLVGAGLLIKSFARVLKSNPGFDPANVLTMQLSLPRTTYSDNEKVKRFHQELLERVAALPGVEAASISNELPGFVTGWQTDIAIKGRPAINPGEELHVDWGIVSADYFGAMKIPVIRGRNFTPHEIQSGAAVVVIDETMRERFWPGEDALGKYILYDSPTPHEIIGVVESVRHYGGETPPRGRIYTPLNRMILRRASLAVRSANADAEGLVASVTREIHAIDKDLPVSEVETMRSLLAQEISPQRFNTILLGVFAAVALTLAAVGLYGVISYSITRRTHEIGIRMALGAQADDVLKLVVRQGMTLALAGVAIGLVAAFALTRVISSLLYGVSATDPLTFAVTSLLLTGVALGACFVPARRATKVDPMVALRHE
jgi:putative ABC transport system permease protein